MGDIAFNEEREILEKIMEWGEPLAPMTSPHYRKPCLWHKKPC